MFCLRATILLSGVTVCAVITTGCASKPSEMQNARSEPQSLLPLSQNTISRPQAMTVLAEPNPPTPERPVTREDIIGWSIRGLSDDRIINRLQSSSAVFHLSTSEEIHLHDAGVSDEVIRAMKATAG